MQAETRADFEMAGPTSGRGSTHRSPLTIGLLFYLVTLGAILSACLRTLVGNESLTQNALTISMIAGVASGFIAGGVLGLFGYKSYKAAWICSCMGLIVGIVAAGLAMVNGEFFNEIAFIAFGGCWLLILIMLVSARFQHQVW